MNKLSITLLLAIMACACNVVEDTSTPAVEVGDKTLLNFIAAGIDAHSNCYALPNGGFDICRFIEGTTIKSSWNIIIPKGSSIVGNQIVLFYRDFQKTYSAQDAVISIPFSDILQAKTWSKDLEGEVEALAMVQYKDSSGIIKTARALGIARILVLPASYNQLPLDSGSQAFAAKVTCRLQMATSGRSAYECK